MRRFSALLVFGLAASGCLGGYAPGTPGSAGTPGTPGTAGTPGTPGQMAALDGQQTFLQNVAPILLANCSGCHSGTGPTEGPTFLGSDGSQYYGKLVADPRFVNNAPAQSLLLTQGKHEGPAFTTAQGAAVMSWLQLEVTERPGLPAPPPALNVAQRKLQDFAACMSLTDYNSSGMNTLQNQGTNGNGGSCTSCHQTGEYVLLSADTNANFNALITMPFIMKFAEASVAVDGTFTDIVATNRFKDRGTEPGHPSYTLTTARQTALTSFFTLTYNKWKAGNCVAAAPASTDGGM
jgi:mono/diheme cytochrome c family protein